MVPNPEVLKKIHPTFLYLSLSSFDKNSHLKINRPQKNFWKRILKSLEILRKKKMSYCFKNYFN